MVYVSPLKALSNDIQKNLEEPFREIQQLALERGYLSMDIRTAVRTGDTLQKERASMLRNPPHILVTTPESLYILLTSKRSREHLACVETVIVDEITRSPTTSAVLTWPCRSNDWTLWCAEKTGSLRVLHYGPDESASTNWALCDSESDRACG